MIGVLSLCVAALCAATMGYAIQRGATCTVAAVNELVAGRGPSRLAALLEASIWVAGGLLVAQRFGWIARSPEAYALGRSTVAGAALLGLGAWLAGACVFGAVARLGSGDWAHAATPLGFYLGCLSVGQVFGSPSLAGAPAGVDTAGVDTQRVPALLIASIALALGWRAWRIARRRAWTPHAATLVIGVTFVALLVLAGSWAYTDVLAEIAHGMRHEILPRLLLALSLLLGAIAGGWRGGLLRWRRPAPRAVARCLCGGVLMGWGSLLIPGSNDGLILVGMPLLRPYAWAAFATMCLAIAAAALLRRRLSRSLA